MNMHVNNAMYIDWMQECLSLEESKNVSRFDIIYMRESLEGDIISASVEQAESGIKKLQLINQDEKTIALAEVNFGAD